MSHRPRRDAMTVCVGFAVLLLLASPCPARSDAIDAGFDLFDPMSGSQIFVPTFGLVPVIGVPIPSFPEFGSAPLGNTNSIVHRDLGVSDTGPLQTPVEMVAMQMMSTDGTNLFFSLQTAGPGLMTFQFGPTPNFGTFTWSNDLSFNVTIGGFGGPSVVSFNVLLTSAPTPWSNVAPSDAVCIPTKNCFLNGIDNSRDFFPIGSFQATGANGTSIIFGNATIPEPGTAVLAGTGLILVLIKLRGRSKASSRRS